MDVNSNRFLDAKEQLLTDALVKHPNRPDLLYQLAELFLDRGAASSGAKLYRRAYLAQPEIRPNPSLDWVDDVHSVQRVYDRTSSLIAEGVCYSAVIWAKLVAAAQLGRRTEVAGISDYQLLFQESSCAFPEASDSSFMDGLADEIRGGMRHHKIDGWTAIKQASRNSRIMNCGLPHCEVLAERLIDKVRNYAAHLRSSNKEHLQTKNIPKQASISAWSVLLDGKSRHITHIHPRAWASGVFYITQPKVKAGSRSGWFRAGPPPTVRSDSGWSERWVEPNPGTCALMPAYFSHETVPTDSDEERMCVAFDVMPTDLAVGVSGSVEFLLT